jgi:hypothetical protein
VPPESQKVNTANQTRTSGFAGAQFPPVMRSEAGSGLGCAECQAWKAVWRFSVPPLTGAKLFFERRLAFILYFSLNHMISIEIAIPRESWAAEPGHAFDFGSFWELLRDLRI